MVMPGPEPQSDAGSTEPVGAQVPYWMKSELRSIAQEMSGPHGTYRQSDVVRAALKRLIEQHRESGVYPDDDECDLDALRSMSAAGGMDV
jgi:hypothetical protein